MACNLWVRKDPTIPMSAADPVASDRPRRTVFLSYASEDRAAAQALRDALPRYGLEVWYDESDLVGGDVWDQKIRRQIRECDYFMPVISANTEARREGYFRREWRLAVERTLDMADDYIFLVPVVIDETTRAYAHIPEKFLTVQWLRVPGGQPTAALEALCQRLIAGRSPPPLVQKRFAELPATPRAQAPSREFPEFPREEPGQKMRFWAQMIGWSFHSGWIAFKRLPKWLRIIICLWLAVVALSRGCQSEDHRSRITADQAKNLAQISGNSPQESGKQDIANFAAQSLEALPRTAQSALAALARHGQIGL